MSKYMLDDQKTIDDVNPFVQEDFSLPGTWSDPYEFVSYENVPEEASTLDKDTKSPLCETMGSLGDYTIASCNPREPNCPMSRPLEPERLIDPGMWTYQKKEAPTKKSYEMYYILAAVIMLLAASFLRY